MNKNIEVELKILLCKEEFEMLANSYGPLNFTTQVNVYYDTPCHYLKRNNMAMRIRTIANIHLFTLKIKSEEGLIEHECELMTNSIDALDDIRVQELINTLHIPNSFNVLGSLSTRRSTIDTEFAELCFDINEYNSVNDYEIEYEYKVDHDGILEFNKILNRIGKVYTKNSAPKIVRALCY